MMTKTRAIEVNNSQLEDKALEFNRNSDNKDITMMIIITNKTIIKVPVKEEEPLTSIMHLDQ